MTPSTPDATSSRGSSTAARRPGEQYRNLVELAALQAHVARELGSSPGRLVLHVKTAHVYEPELELMRGLTTPAARRA